MERGFVDAIIEKNGGSSYQKLDESKRTEQQQSSESWMKTLAISIFFFLQY